MQALLKYAMTSSIYKQEEEISESNASNEQDIEKIVDKQIKFLTR